MKRIILYTAKTLLLPVVVLTLLLASLVDGLMDIKAILKEWYE